MHIRNFILKKTVTLKGQLNAHISKTLNTLLIELKALVVNNWFISQTVKSNVAIKHSRIKKIYVKKNKFNYDARDNPGKVAL